MTSRQNRFFGGFLAPGLAFVFLMGLGTACDSSPKFGAFGKAKPSIPLYSDNCAALLGIGGTQGILLDKTYFVVNYCPAWGSPFWVAECLQASDIKKTSKRPPFFADPNLPESLRVTPGDYTGSGFDRGHLAPYADMARSKAAMKASMVMSNMHPQYPSLNRESWRLLEEAVRDSVAAKGKGWVVTGQIVRSVPFFIGKKHGVVVPDLSFKVVLLLDDAGHYSGFGALGLNVKDDAPTDYVSIDSVEVLSGFDFFPLLPDSIENRIESGAP